VKFLFIDAGSLHQATAAKVGSEGHIVFYWSPWNSSYPKFKDYAPGVGIPEFTKVLEYASYLDDVDIIVFPDVGMGALCDYLRSKGYDVFGAGLGEEAEQDRIKSIEIMDKYGIAHPDTKVFKGINEVLKFLESEDGKSETNQLSDGKYFVKFNIWRGSIDSFPVESLPQAKDMFAKVRAEIGPYADEMEIIVQTKVEGVESGFDIFFNGNEVLTPIMWGFESGGNYIGYIDDVLPDFLNDSLSKAIPYLRSINYRGAFSVEVIYDGKESYWIDWTCRYPMPLGLMYSQFIPNYGEFIAAIARGESVSTGLPKGTYLGAAEFTSENALNDWLPVSTNEHTKLVRYMQVKDQEFIVPGVSTLGIVTGEGDDFKALKADLDKNIEGVSAFFGKVESNFIPTIIDKYVDPLSKLGIKFGDGSKVESSRGSRARELLNRFNSKY
jgi:hypothetical protein